MSYIRPMGMILPRYAVLKAARRVSAPSNPPLFQMSGEENEPTGANPAPGSDAAFANIPIKSVRFANLLAFA